MRQVRLTVTEGGEGDDLIVRPKIDLANGNACAILLPAHHRSQGTILKRILRAAKAAILSTACLLAWSSTAHAEGLVVPDASVLQYSVQDGRVYFRNLNQVDSTWLACCSNYWIDLSTDNGRAQFSAFLSAKVSHQRIVFYVTSKAAPTVIGLVGDF
jgi:hypothetical protein